MGLPTFWVFKLIWLIYMGEIAAHMIHLTLDGHHAFHPLNQPASISYLMH